MRKCADCEDPGNSVEKCGDGRGDDTSGRDLFGMYTDLPGERNYSVHIHICIHNYHAPSFHTHTQRI